MLELDRKLKLDKILASTNVAENLKDKDLETIGNYVWEGYDVDKTSRKEWESNVDEWVKLALQVAETKSHPWPNAANVKYPLITTAALQFSARAYPALLPGTSPVRGRVIGYDTQGTKTERALRIGKHMSYQILEEMEDWEEEMDRLLFALPIMGCMFKKTYFDAIKQSNTSEVVYPKELVVNYWAKNLEESERITHVLKMSSNDIYERVAEGIYIEQELGTPTTDIKKDTKVSEDNAGIKPPEQQDDTTPYCILEQCTYLDLDGDGYKEPYVVTIEETSKRVLRIVPRFTEDDIRRGLKGELVRIKPTNYYTKFSFIPSPDGGFYDIGFGVLLGPINNTINTLINQLLDSGTLSNMQSGFISKGIRIKGGNKQFAPGEWKYANSIGDDLRKGLVPLPVREPSQVLFSLLGMMVESGEKLSSVTEIMTGDIPGQNTKATVAMAAIEQGMKVFSSIYKRIHRSLSKEYKKLFTLNSIFLPKETYFVVLDAGKEGAAQIGVDDYNMEDIDVLPTSDPNVATQEQKMAKIEAAGQMVQLGTVNPQEFTKRYLEALEIPNAEPLLKMPEPQPNPEVELEKAKFEDESQRGWEELAIKRSTAEAAALKNIADAEAAENGEQIEQYKAQLKSLQDDNIAQIKVAHMEQLHQMKMKMQDEMHKQKIAQQQAMDEQKLRQEKIKTFKFDRDDNGNISGATVEQSGEN